MGPEAAEPPGPASGLSTILIFPVLNKCPYFLYKPEHEKRWVGYSSALEMFGDVDRYCFSYVSQVSWLQTTGT